TSRCLETVHCLLDCLISAREVHASACKSDPSRRCPFGMALAFLVAEVLLMNRMLCFLLPLESAYNALGQTPAPPTAAPANLATESSKVARFLAGPGDRPQ